MANCRGSACGCVAFALPYSPQGYSNNKYATFDTGGTEPWHMGNRRRRLSRASGPIEAFSTIRRRSGTIRTRRREISMRCCLQRRYSGSRFRMKRRWSAASIGPAAVSLCRERSARATVDRSWRSWAPGAMAPIPRTGNMTIMVNWPIRGQTASIRYRRSLAASSGQNLTVTTPPASWPPSSRSSSPESVLSSEAASPLLGTRFDYRLWSGPAVCLTRTRDDDRPSSGDENCGSEAMAKALQRELTSIDVSDPHLYQDDNWQDLFAKLRHDDPVHYCEDSPFGSYWSVTRYDDIFAVELDHENYSSSSELGGIQITDQPLGQEFAN